MDVPYEDILINQANIQWFQLVWFKNVAYVLFYFVFNVKSVGVLAFGIPK